MPTSAHFTCLLVLKPLNFALFLIFMMICIHTHDHTDIRYPVTYTLWSVYGGFTIALASSSIRCYLATMMMSISCNGHCYAVYRRSNGHVRFAVMSRLSVMTMHDLWGSIDNMVEGVRNATSHMWGVAHVHGGVATHLEGVRQTDTLLQCTSKLTNLPCIYTCSH